MGNINKNKDNKKKKKLPFGRNIFTLIFVFACVAVLFLIVYTVQSYVTAASEAKYTPFVTQSIADGKATDFEEGSFNNIDETFMTFCSLSDMVNEALPENEYFWFHSLPCILPKEDKIPIAQYEYTEEGQKSEEYRVKLAKKYGLKKQMIYDVLLLRW